MNKEGHIRQTGFTPTTDNKEADYTDDSIAIHTDIRELPLKDGSMQTDKFTLLACTNGKLQVEMNTQTYTIRKNEVLACLPNIRIHNFMQSPDFEGAVMCFSKRGMLEQVSENEIWDKAFIFAENPIIHVSEDSLYMFGLYSSMLKAKIRMKEAPFFRKIIASIVKAALYELLANVEKEPVSYGSGLIKQREVLFKRFLELLSSTRIKPRNVSWYAERLCVTPKYLSTICKQVSGKTAFIWINESIGVDIRFWLKNSNKTIKEIADMLLFPTNSFFGKYCRAHFGMSPMELRMHLREYPENTDKS